jgi:hypothetical protein
MTRLVGVAGVTAVNLMVFTGVAGATGSEATHLRSGMATAVAGWHSESGGRFWESGVTASRSLSGSASELHIYQTVGQIGGRTTGLTADATAGFAFTIDSKRLGGASLSATNLPATVCTYTSRGAVVGKCAQTTIDVELTWTGQGAVAKENHNEHVTLNGSSMHIHVVTTSRDALATGSLNGALSTNDLAYAKLSTEKLMQTGR